MTIGPIGLLLLCLHPRVVYLYRKAPRDGSKDGAYTAKLVGRIILCSCAQVLVASLTLSQISYGWFAAVQTAILVSWTSSNEPVTRTTIPAAALSLVAAIMLGVASHFEHTRSVKPALLNEIYLFFTIAFDAVRLRTLWGVGYQGHIFKLSSISVVWKLVLLVQEAWPQALGTLGQSYSPEEKVGWINRRMFWWVNPLLFLGSKKYLQADDLFTLNRSLQSEVCSKSFSKVWQNCRLVPLSLLHLAKYEQQARKEKARRLDFSGLWRGSTSWFFSRPLFLDCVSRLSPSPSRFLSMRSSNTYRMCRRNIIARMDMGFLVHILLYTWV